LNRTDEWRKFVGVAPAYKYREAFGRKFLGNGRPDKIAGPDDRDSCIASRHVSAP
jgi:hypothetical protein